MASYYRGTFEMVPYLLSRIKLLTTLLAFISFCFLLPTQTSFAFGGPSKDASDAKSGSSTPMESKEPTARAADPKKPATPDKQLAYIAVKGPKFETKNDYPRSEILKVAMDEIIRTQKFELVFSSTQAYREANYLFFELHLLGKEVKWGKDQKGYDLDFFLFNGKTGKLITEAHRTRIFDRHLVYTARTMLYEVFYGKELANQKSKRDSEQKSPVEKAEDKKEDQEAPKQSEQNLEVPQEKNAEQKPEPEVPQKGKSKSPTKQDLTPPKKLAPEPQLPKKEAKSPEEEEEEASNKKESEESNDSSNKSASNEGQPPSEKKQPPPETEKAQPKEKMEAEQPEKLAQEIEEEIKKQKVKLKKEKKTLEDKIKEDEKEKVAEAKKEPPGEEADFSLVPQAAQPNSTNQVEKIKSLKSYQVSFDLLVQQVTSTDLITVNNTFTHFGLNGMAFIQFDPQSEDALKINLRITQVVSSGEYDVPGMKQLGLVYRKAIPILSIYPSAGFEYETQSFVNLNTEGGGLSVNQNTLLWYKGNLEIFIPVKNRKLFLLGGMARTFVGSTDYGGDGKSVSIDGSRIEAGVRYEFIRNTFIEVLTQRARMQSQGLSNLVNNQTSTYISMVYPL